MVFGVVSRLRISISFLLLFLVSACVPLIGQYSPTAYQNATSLKATTLVLMDKASQPYQSQERNIESLMLEVDKAYEFVNGVEANNISAQQWSLLKKPDGDLLGRFILRWKERNTLSQDLITEFKSIISDAFDQIICLEANKKEATACLKKGGK